MPVEVEAAGCFSRQLHFGLQQRRLLLLLQSDQLLQLLDLLLLLLLLVIMATVVPTQFPYCVRGRCHPESRRDPSPTCRRPKLPPALSQSPAVGSMPGLPSQTNSDRQALKQLMGPK